MSTADAIDETTGAGRPLTKIIATIGPATSDEAGIDRLIRAGARVFRLNFSHGQPEDHADAAARIRTVSRQLQRPVAILGDLQGPKIRLGEVPGGAMELEAGQTIVIQRSAPAGANASDLRFSTTCPSLIDEVWPGQRLLINDGAVRTLVTETGNDELRCTVTHGGPIGTAKGINLPDTELSLDVITPRDRQYVDWAMAHDLDLLALSFVRTDDDVRRLRSMVEEAAKANKTTPVPIIAKIERPGAVARIEQIVEAADGIMIARGDLGVEMDLARLPVIQRQLIAVAQEHGKPCIVATQMLESMVHAPAPTRAEANDVADAIFRRVDAVMLSAETAVGRYPALAVEHMRRIAEQCEAYLTDHAGEPTPPVRLQESGYHTAALAHGVLTVARDIGARCIVVWSQGGGGARYLSQNRAPIPIVAVTSDERVARRMQTFRGVTPHAMELPTGLGDFTQKIDVQLQAAGFAAPGDVCILVAGKPLSQPGRTNSLAVHVVGDPESGYAGYA